MNPTAPKILTLDEIRAKLQDRRLEVVSKMTGLHYNTLLLIRDNKNSNVKYSTLAVLSAYFDANK